MPMLKRLDKRLDKRLSKNTGVLIPSNASAWFDFTSSNLETAVTDQATGFVRLQCQCDSPRTIEQSDGTYETFPSNVVAFKRGVHFAGEPPATNLHISSSLDNDGSSFTDISYQDSDSNGFTSVNKGEYNEITFATSAGAQRNVVNPFIDQVSGTTYTASVVFKELTVGTLQVFGLIWPTGANTKVFKLDGVTVNGSDVINQSSGTLEVIFTATATATIGVPCGVGAISSSSVISATSLTFLLPQIEEGSSRSSPIITSGAATTRDASINSFAPNTAFVDNEVFLSDYTGGGYLNGVRTSVKSVTFLFTTGATVAGKYAAKGTSDWIGSRWYQPDNGAFIEIVSMGSQTGTYIELTNPITGLLTTDAEVQAGFQNTGDSTNTFQIDWHLSGYDTTTVTALRDSVGDSGYVELPTINFTAQTGFTFLATPQAAGSIYWRGDLAPNNGGLLASSAGDLLYLTNNTGNDDTVSITPSSFAAGDSFDAETIKTSTTQTINADSQTDSTASTQTVMNGNALSFGPVNLVAQNALGVSYFRMLDDA